MIVNLLPCRLSDKKDRYLSLDRFIFKDRFLGIAPKYIDIEYSIYAHELSSYFSSFTEISGSAGITIYGDCNGSIPAVNVNRYPVYEASRTLHTMIDRIDSLNLFRRWLHWHRDLGFDAVSIALNISPTHTNKSSRLCKMVYEESLLVFDKTVLSLWPFQHRYKPCFHEFSYIGRPSTIAEFVRYAPGNFHHIQHLAMRMSTFFIESCWHGFCDVDEFILPSVESSSFWSNEFIGESSCLYFQNAWHYLVDEKVGLVMPISSILPIGSRSKYIVKSNNVYDFGIHEPILNQDVYSKVAGKIVHLINYSSYSGRNCMAYRDLLADVGSVININDALASAFEI